MYKVGITCLLATCLATIGCLGSGGAARVDTYKVTGKVTMNGAPVPGATVSFSPVTTGKPAAFAITDGQGVYVLTTYDNGDGAAEGDYKVMVSKSAPSTAESSGPAHDPTGQGPRSAPSHSGPGKGAQAGGGSLLPDKYAKATTTPITKTVQAQDNTIDIDLE